MIKKKFKAVELNCLNEDTIRDIRLWRNQEFVRCNMFCQDIITEAEHNAWVQRVKADADRMVFVFYLDDVPFGVETYTYDRENQWVKVGNYLTAEEYQSLGYGVILTYFGMDIMYNVLGYEELYAEILEYNNRSASVSRFFDDKKEFKEEPITLNGKTYRVSIVRGTKQIWNDFEKEKLGKLVMKFVQEDYEVIK